MKQLFKTVALLSFALTAVACSQDHPESATPNTTRQADTTQTERLPLGVSVQPEQEAREIRSLDSQAPQAKALQFEIHAGSGANSASVVPKVDVNNMSSFEGVVTFYNKTRNESISITSRFTKRTGAAGQQHYMDAPVNFPSNWNVRTGNPTIYMQIIAGAGTYQNNKLNVGEEIVQLPQLELAAGKKTFSIQAPFASSWRQVRWDNALQKIVLNKQTTQADKVLRLSPQGLFLVFNVENWMTLGVNIERTMQLESNGYANRGYYDMQKFRATLGSSNISEGSTPQLNKAWMTTSEETVPSKQNSYFRDNDKRHYISKFKLMPGAGESDSPIHIAKRTGSTATQYGKYYILWVQQINANGGKNLIYASADVNESGRTRYTSDASSYQGTIQPNTWKPRLGKRYIISGFGAKNEGVDPPINIKPGTAYILPLRIVRPMIPIEYMSWPGVSDYRDAGNKAPTGQRLAKFADWNVASQTTHWRLPKAEEIYHITSTCSRFLDANRNPTYGTAGAGSAQATYLRPGVLKLVSYAPGSQYVDIGGKTKLYYPIASYVRTVNEKTIYAVMYQGTQLPTPESQRAGAVNTNVYRVFVRFTLKEGKWSPSDRPERPNVLKIEHYYLGTALNWWSDDNVITYGLTPQFWDNLVDPQAVYSREIMFVTADPAASGEGNVYWLDGGTRVATKINNFGRHDGNISPGRNDQAYFLPWLKDQYRSW